MPPVTVWRGGGILHNLFSSLSSVRRTNLRIPMPTVYQQELDSLTVAIRAALPSYAMIRSRLYRARQTAISSKRRPDSLPAESDDDRAVMRVKTAENGTANSDKPDWDGISAAEVVQDSSEGPNPGDVVEVTEASAELEDAVESGGSFSCADNIESVEHRGISDKEECNKTGDDHLSGRAYALKHGEPASSAVERLHGINPRAPERDACATDEDRLEYDRVERWRGPEGTVVGRGAIRTSDLPPVEFTMSARGLPILQVQHYQFRRWKGEHGFWLPVQFNYTSYFRTCKRTPTSYSPR